MELPQIETLEMRFLKPDEIKLLAETIDGRYRAMVLAAAYSGLRLESSALSGLITSMRCV